MPLGLVVAGVDLSSQKLDKHSACGIIHAYADASSSNGMFSPLQRAGGLERMRMLRANGEFVEDLLARRWRRDYVSVVHERYAHQASKLNVIMIFDANKTRFF